MATFPYLSFLIFLPLAGMIAIAAIPKEQLRIIRYLTVGITFAQLVLAVLAWSQFGHTVNTSTSAYRFVERAAWIRLSGLGVFGNMAIDYFLGVDGISILMVLLTALVGFLGSFASFSIDRSLKGYYMMYLLLLSGIMGVFCSLDLFLFYVFWEVMLVPVYFLIGVWGGPRREFAATKFFLYSLFGSAIMLLTMIAMYFSTNVTLTEAGKQMSYHSFSLLDMMDPAKQSADGLFHGIATNWRYAGYFALLFGFAIKVPIFPFHSWLVDAHVEAPTPVAVLLSAVLLKTGAYGILRICYGVFPEIAITTSWYLAMAGFINIVYGALCALAQKDLKRLIAYSSISHMGYVLLGIASLNTQGITGAVFQMFNHGTIVTLLFLLSGILYERARTLGLNEFGGLANQMPRFFGFAVIAFFAALGLPMMSGFISQAFVFMGSFQKWQVWTLLSTLGLILTAAYMLWTLQRMFFGSTPERWIGLEDISWKEAGILIPLAAIVIFLGVYPSPVLDLMIGSVNQLVSLVGNAGVSMGQVAGVVQ